MHYHRMLKARFIPIPLAFIALLVAAMSAPPLARAEEAKPLVVVELFTSQGCSSCPPADTYLGELAAEPNVLALAFHVDYWNYIGWTDPYATKLATQRQHDYSRQLGLRYVYTPQMVIDGATEGVGSERQTIAPLIKAAAKDAQKTAVTLRRNTDGKLVVHVGDGTAQEPATIWLVGIDHERSTKVTRGENGGTTLHEFQIVRSFKEIGTWRGQALDLTVAGSEAAGDGNVAVLIQLGGTGHIIGAAALKPPTS